MDAEKTLEAVKNDAVRYKTEVAAECEVIKEAARKEGYEAGFKEWGEHVARLEEEISKVRQEMEKVVIPVALKAAKKILGKEIELNENAILDIVSNCLKSVSTHKKITIYVNRKDLEILESNKNRLKQIFENLETLSIRERADIEPSGCIIETEGGIINAQLSNQWTVLENAFENLMKQRKI